MLNTLEKELKKLPSNFIVYVILPLHHYEAVNTKLMHTLVNKMQLKGSYLTVNQPYKRLVEMLSKKKVLHDNIFFLDCISKQVEDAPNCYCLKTPSNLTEIEIALQPILRNKSQSFLLIDSLDTMTNYHEPQKIIKFCREIVERVRENNSSCILLGVHEETDKKVEKALYMLTDKVIDLSRY